MRQDVLNPLTYDEHRDLSQEIQKTRARLAHLASVILGVYGQQSRSAFAFRKVNEAIDRLCVELGTQAITDCPGLDADKFYRQP